ncbi:MAG: sigma-54 dependent transcriptional regulator [Desulfobacterales bacterium]
MSPAKLVLVVDDDHAHRTMLTTLLAGWGYQTATAPDGDQALARVREQPYDLVLMDIRMLKMSGIEALEGIKAHNPAVPVVMMTAYSSVETAVAALKKGAYDYLTKPLDFDELRLTLERAMDHRRLKAENADLRQRLQGGFDRGGIVGRGQAMTQLLETVRQVAASEATVLITGESGTGKELIAGAIHANSPRRGAALVKVNCAALSETLLESELFGHVKGAFTGAHRTKSGCFQQAHGGTLFLDEVSEMSPGMQVKLLRVLQEAELTQVGGETVIRVDVRIVAATNKELLQAVSRNRFREDLYYRLNVVALKMPPLRMRREDIPLLAQHFLSELSEKNQKRFKGFTPQAMDQLLKHNWPGNVRELMNVVERAVVMAQGEYIDAKGLDLEDSPQAVASLPADSEAPISGAQPLEEVERDTILKTLEVAGGNKSETARRLGITRRTLHKKLKKYGAMP